MASIVIDKRCNQGLFTHLRDRRKGNVEPTSVGVDPEIINNCFRDHPSALFFSPLENCLIRPKENPKIEAYWETLSLPNPA
jgi:hypothetical protein